jgi:hypothetical protein
LPDEIKQSLTQSLAASTLMSPSAYPTLFPLVPVEVLKDFADDSFFLIKADLLEQCIFSWHLVPTQFPPFPTGKAVSVSGRLRGSEHTQRRRRPRKRATQSSEQWRFCRIRSSVTTSGRKMFGGRLAGGWQCQLSYGEPCTPAMMENIRIEAHDHA